MADLSLIESLDMPVYHIFPEWKQGLKKLITLRHLLNHCSGLQSDRIAIEIYESPDFVQLALCADTVAQPGSHFFYNNKAVNLLPKIIERVSGERCDQFFHKHFMVPLNAGDFKWCQDSVGNFQGFASLHLTAEDLLKIGQMICQHGS